MQGVKSIYSDAILISKDIDRFLLKEGFLEGHFDDCYSGVKNKVFFNKYLGCDDSGNSYTAVVTINEIAIEEAYDYGGGVSAGFWLFDNNIESSFAKAYNYFIEKIIDLKRNKLLIIKK